MSLSRGTALCPSHPMYRSRTLPLPGSTSRSYAEASFDLVGPGDVFTREARGDARERFELTVQPAPAIFLEVGYAEPLQQDSRFIAEALRIDELIGSDGSLPSPWSDERVDELVDVAADPQAQPDVALGDVHRSPP